MTTRMLIGDCRHVLATLDDASVHCVVTSPPYFGLRDYGTAQWQGGDPACRHIAPATGSTQNKGNNNRNGKPFHNVCGLCGGKRIDNQIGIEPTPDAYVAELVAVFRLVRRVLRDDGTVWLNLGDSYGSGTIGRNDLGKRISDGEMRDTWKSTPNMGVRKAASLKPKDMLGVPWLVAFALRADGWYLRQDIIWAKPNPMPESVRDRCTKAHEYIFLLAKNARYYFDAVAIAEPVARLWDETNGGSLAHKEKFPRNTAQCRNGEPYPLPNANGIRNKRSVWEIASQPFAEAHFATFPPALIEPCILAGCPKGGTVLDPFAGAGTTGMVADRLGRNAVLIELNPDYAAMTDRRIRDDAGMFAEII